LLLDIETRIGEICLKEKKVKPKSGGDGGGSIPSGIAPKHERLGLPHPRRVADAQVIAKNPTIVKEIKERAVREDDIPSKAAVINEVRYRREKKRRKEAEGKREKIKAVIAIEQVQYINKLDQIISICPIKPPEDWNEDALREATAKAKIIIKRLEVFNG